MPHFDSPPPSEAGSVDADTLSSAFSAASEIESTGSRRSPLPPETQQANRTQASITSIDRHLGIVNLTFMGMDWEWRIAHTDNFFGAGFIDAFDPGAREAASRAREQRLASAALRQGGLLAPPRGRRHDPSVVTQNESQEESQSRERSDGAESYGVSYLGSDRWPPDAQIISSNEESPAPPESHSQSEPLFEENESQSRGRPGAENDYGVPYDGSDDWTSAAQIISSDQESHALSDGDSQSEAQSEQSEALSEDQAARSPGRSTPSSPPRRVSIAPLDRRPPPW